MGMLFVCLFFDGQKIIYKQDVKRETANNSRSAIKVNINKMTRILHGVDKGKKKKILLVVSSYRVYILTFGT